MGDKQGEDTLSVPRAESVCIGRGDTGGDTGGVLFILIGDVSFASGFIMSIISRRICSNSLNSSLGNGDGK